MTPKHTILVAALVAGCGAAWLALRSSPRDASGAEAGGTPESTPNERPVLVAPVPDAKVEARASAPPGAALAEARVRVSIEGEIAVRGGGSAERFARMELLALSASGVGAAGRIAHDGTFVVELEARATDVTDPFLVSLDTGGGQRLRQSVAVQPAIPTEAGERAYVGRAVFEISDRCVVKGRAVDEAGQPLSGLDAALVLASTTDESFQVLVLQPTGADGEFWLESPPYSELLLVVVGSQTRPLGRRLETLAGGEIDVGTLVLAPAETISGTLLANDAERTVADLQILARRRAKRNLLLGGHFLDVDGETVGRWYLEAPVEASRFVLPGLDPAEYKLEVTRREGAASLPGVPEGAQVVRAPATDIVLDLEETQLWLRLRDARTARPVPAKVQVSGAFGEFAFPTDRQGTVLIIVVPETDYRVIIDAPGYDHEELELRSPAKNAFQDFPVDLDPIEPGDLTLALERPWTGRGRVSLTLQGDDRAQTSDVDVVDGRVELRTLRPGFYSGTLEVWGAGELRGLGEDEDLSLTFVVRVRPGETTEQQVLLR